MMYLYWLLMVPVSLCFTLLALFLAPVLPIFARDEYGLCDNGNAKRTEPLAMFCFSPRITSFAGEAHG